MLLMMMGGVYVSSHVVASKKLHFHSYRSFISVYLHAVPPICQVLVIIILLLLILYNGPPNAMGVMLGHAWRLGGWMDSKHESMWLWRAEDKICGHRRRSRWSIVGENATCRTRE